MEIGIFAKTFERASLGETLGAVRACGLSTIQFNMALVGGGASLPDEIAPAVAGSVRSGVERRGLRIAAVSGTYNMAHPDAGVRSDGLRRLGALIARVPAMGCECVTLCTGTRDAQDMWRWHPDNATPSAWADMRASVEAALVEAERHEVTLGFEPEFNNVVCDAVLARRLLDELGCPSRLKVVIDPANLLLGGAVDRQADVLNSAFDLLGEDLVLAHAKDVTSDGTIVAAGQGALDYDLYVSLLASASASGAVPLIMHGLSEGEVPACRAFVESTVARAGGL